MVYMFYKVSVENRGFLKSEADNRGRPRRDKTGRSMSQRRGTPVQVPQHPLPEKHRLKALGRAVAVTGPWPDPGRGGTGCDLVEPWGQPRSGVSSDGAAVGGTFQKQREACRELDMKSLGRWERHTLPSGFRDGSPQQTPPIPQPGKLRPGAVPPFQAHPQVPYGAGAGAGAPSPAACSSRPPAGASSNGAAASTTLVKRSCCRPRVVTVS